MKLSSHSLSVPDLLRLHASLASSLERCSVAGLSGRDTGTGTGTFQSRTILDSHTSRN